jgi:hypothetical protein
LGIGIEANAAGISVRNRSILVLAWISWIAVPDRATYFWHWRIF